MAGRTCWPLARDRRVAIGRHSLARRKDADVSRAGAWDRRAFPLKSQRLIKSILSLEASCFPNYNPIRRSSGYGLRFITTAALDLTGTWILMRALVDRS